MDGWWMGNQWESAGKNHGKDIMVQREVLRQFMDVDGVSCLFFFGWDAPVSPFHHFCMGIFVEIRGNIKIYSWIA